MQCSGRLEWCLYCRVLPFSHCYSQGKGEMTSRIQARANIERVWSEFIPSSAKQDFIHNIQKRLDLLTVRTLLERISKHCEWRSELESSTILCIGAGDWRLETRRNLDIPGSWDTAGDTDRAERGQRRAAELSPDTGGHPTLTTPRTHQHRGHYQFILLGGYCLRCIFIALAKVNKCNQQEIYLIPACHIPKKEVS